MDTRLLSLTLQSPLAVTASRGRSSNRYATPVVVPPPTLRGALAAAVDRAGADPGTMERLFDRAGCRTSALVPSGPGEAPALPQVAPLTLRTCKRRGGFRADATPEHSTPQHEAHGVEDTLFASLALALQDDPSPLQALRTCRVDGCGNVLKRKGGLLRPPGSEEGAFRTQPLPGRRTQTHVGIDRRRDGAASGALYAREVINEKMSGGDGGLVPTPMQAAVTGSPEVLSVLEDALAQEEELRVGTALSRGLGHCEVKTPPLRDLPSQLPIRERIEAFNERWQERGGEGGPLVALTLQTPALFVDKFLRPETAPSGRDLLQAAGDEEHAHAEVLSSLDRVHQVARPYQLQAWNGLAGFPHATDQGLKAGSVLVYRADEITDALLDALSHVEQAGIGLRRELGLGRVRVCDPVHTRAHEHSDHSESSN